MAVAAATRLEKRNWLIHQLYIKQEFSECLELIETQLHATKGLSEYALYVKGLVKRQEGAIEESLQLFQAAAFLSPKSVANLKQVARSLYLLGKHKAAIGVYRELLDLPGGDEDWEVYHAQGMCHMYLQQLDSALECLESANAIQRHDATFLAMANVYSLQDKLDDAIGVLEEALEFSADSSDILTLLGLLYLRMDDNLKAFEYLGSSLTHDPRNAKTILAAGSIMQDHGEYDVALSKYRTAAQSTPHSPHLWSNIGMCFFGKEKYVAAIACLKRAQYLDPFEWIVAYNIGLVLSHTGQYASAYAALAACVNLAPKQPQVYSLMAVVLARLGDVPSAHKAYGRAVALEPQDAPLRLNYAVSMANAGDKAEAATQLAEFKRLWAAMPPEDKEGLDEARMLALSEAVSTALQRGTSKPPATHSEARPEAVVMFSSLYQNLPTAAAMLPSAGRKADGETTALTAARKTAAAYSSEVHDASYYAKCMVGGIFSCGLTHAAITPMDVVKCRMQTNPEVYTGVFKGFSILSSMPGGVVANGTVGFLPTLIGYSAQGLFKFGLYEIFKDVYSNAVGPENAFKYRTYVFLAGSASAEFFADIALCPMEAVKVRMQTSPAEAKFPTSLGPAISRITEAEGVNGLYKGLTPLWGRQIPYTMVKFAAFERVVEFFYSNVFTAGKENYGKSTQLGVTFASGYIAGVFCAIVSHPADTIVSKLNQNSSGGIGAIVKEMGMWNLATKGLAARIFMIGTLTGLQWWIYDTFKVAVGLKTSGGAPPAEKK